VKYEPKSLINKLQFLQKVLILVKKERVFEVERSKLDSIVHLIKQGETAEALASAKNLYKEPVFKSISFFDEVALNTAAKQLKQINPITFIGCDLSLDNSLFTEFYGSLIHVIKNAVAHGIESPEDRVMNGKPKAGQITIKLTDLESQYLLEISDDGAGIKSQNLGQLDSSMIFKAGFSTTTNPDLISGRGYGLNAVITELDKIGGSICVESKPGLGTTFGFYLPKQEKQSFTPLSGVA